jgi:hypothetical protein
MMGTAIMGTAMSGLMDVTHALGLLAQSYEIAGALGRGDGLFDRLRLDAFAPYAAGGVLLLAGLVALPVLVFVIEVWLACLVAGARRIAVQPDRESHTPALSEQPSPHASGTQAASTVPAETTLAAVVIIPAHNEALVIERTLAALVPTLPADVAVLVVADNCDDRTAEIARACGATVLERQDPHRRGKAFALAYAIEALTRTAPPVVVVLDADCLVNRDTIRRLVERVRAEDRPIQAPSLADPRGLEGTVGGLSALAFRFKNLVRPLGLATLGGPCHLMGTGMAVPWRSAETLLTLENHLTEDMLWGTRLAMAGQTARFAPDVGVWSRLPDSDEAFTNQRTRWEQGHLATLTRQTPRLLWQAVRQGRLDLALLALDLAVPPFSLMVAIWLVVTIAMAAGFAAGMVGPLPLFLLYSTGVALTTAVLAGWWVFCREEIPFRTLLNTPVYIARKLPIYARHLLHRGERRWIRTSRTATS